MGGEIGEIELGEWIAESLEIAAIVIISVTMAVALVGTVIESIRTRDHKFHKLFKRRMTPGLLMGLDLLVAADIINSVILDRSLESIVALGVLVLIRTFLAWTLEMEVEGHWPWQPPR